MKQNRSALPEQVGVILERIFTSLNLDIKVQQYQIWDVWESLVGEAIAKQTRPYQVSKMVLWVTVSSSTWMQQLEFMKRQIVEKINERMGNTIISDIRFRIGDISRKDTS